MKKGFTIIEIIISISLILIIGTSATIVVVNNNSKNKLDELEKEIADAANLYITQEVDTDGNTYLNGIQNGGKGVYLNVETLVQSGYLPEKTLTKLEDEAKTVEEGMDYKLLATNSSGTNDSKECGTGMLEYNFNWNVDSSEPIYLCPVNQQSLSTTDDTSFSENVYEYLGGDCSANEPEYSHFSDHNFGGSVNVDIYEPKKTVIHSCSANGNEACYYSGIEVNNYVKFIDFREPEMLYYFPFFNLRILSYNNEYIALIAEGQMDLRYEEEENGGYKKVSRYSPSSSDILGLFEIHPILNLENYDLNNIERYLKKINFCSNDKCTELEKNYIGPLSSDDLECSGMKKNNLSYSYYDEYFNFIIHLNNSWFNNRINYDGIVTSNCSNTSGCSNNKTCYKFFSTSTVKSAHFSLSGDNCANNAEDMILVLDITKWKIKGMGTDENPYILKAIY